MRAGCLSGILLFALLSESLSFTISNGNALTQIIPEHGHEGEVGAVQRIADQPISERFYYQPTSEPLDHIVTKLTGSRPDRALVDRTFKGWDWFLDKIYKVSYLVRVPVAKSECPLAIHNHGECNCNKPDNGQGINVLVQGNTPITQDFVTGSGPNDRPGIILPQGLDFPTEAGPNDRPGIIFPHGLDGLVPQDLLSHGHGYPFLPGGGLLKPGHSDDSLLLPGPLDGTIFRPDGSIVRPDGTILLPDGSIIKLDGSILRPDGSILRPDGTILLSDGSIIRPDGSILKPDGSVLMPDGSIIRPDGSILRPDGSILRPDGSVLMPDGSIIRPDGSILRPDGSVLMPDGSIIRPDGSILRPDGSVLMPDGSIIRPDGSILRPDGSILRPDGTILMPDGSIKRPDGSVLMPDGSIIRPDGSILRPDGSVLMPDGSIIRPDGSILRPDGSILRPDGTILMPDGSIIRPDGSILRPDGSILMPDGTIIMPDGSIIRPDGVIYRPGQSGDPSLRPGYPGYPLHSDGILFGPGHSGYPLHPDDGLHTGYPVGYPLHPDGFLYGSGNQGQPDDSTSGPDNSGLLVVPQGPHGIQSDLLWGPDGKPYRPGQAGYPVYPGGPIYRPDSPEYPGLGLLHPWNRPHRPDNGLIGPDNTVPLPGSGLGHLIVNPNGHPGSLLPFEQGNIDVTNLDNNQPHYPYFPSLTNPNQQENLCIVNGHIVPVNQFPHLAGDGQHGHNSLLVPGGQYLPGNGLYPGHNPLNEPLLHYPGTNVLYPDDTTNNNGGSLITLVPGGVNNNVNGYPGNQGGILVSGDNPNGGSNGLIVGEGQLEQHNHGNIGIVGVPVVNEQIIGADECNNKEDFTGSKCHNQQPELGFVWKCEKVPTVLTRE